jgi:hypothetical protein
MSGLREPNRVSLHQVLLKTPLRVTVSGSEHARYSFGIRSITS